VQSESKTLGAIDLTGSAMTLAYITREAVVAAISEFDALGRDAFLDKYGFGPARSYFLIHEGKRYDSKAIAGAAHGFVSGNAAMTPTDFAGGERTVKAKLTSLGFIVEGPTEAADLPDPGPREPRYWAFFANPAIYKIEAALRERPEDTWVTTGKEIHAGDHAMIWRGRGRDGRRGVVAFAEVIDEPADLDDSANPHWAEAQEPKVEPRVLVRYVLPVGLPLWLEEHEDVLGRLSVARAKGGTVFNVTEEQWNAVVELAGGWPEDPPPRPNGVGRPYVNDGPRPRSAPRDPFEVDPDAVDRGNQAHLDTQNGLADFLRADGIVPLAPSGDDPEFDLAWERGGTLFVAEVKSTTADNEEKQLRLGLGQVLRYRHLLGGPERTVLAVLVAESQPADATWVTTCSSLGVVLTWPGAFDALAAPAT
jgi:hypothetical protein